MYINLKINTDEKVYNIVCKKGDDLKKILNKENINLRFPCGGAGRCGNCKIKVIKGNKEFSRLEKMKLSEKELKEGYKLACNMNIDCDTEITLKEITGFNFINS